MTLRGGAGQGKDTYSSSFILQRGDPTAEKTEKQQEITHNLTFSSSMWLHQFIYILFLYSVFVLFTHLNKLNFEWVHLFYSPTWRKRSLGPM